MKTTSKHYIYKAIKDDRVIYVGITKSLEKRFAQHSRTSLWWNLKDYMVYSVVDNETVARIYEMYYMNKFKTEYNIQDQRREYVGGIGLSSLEFKKYIFPMEDFTTYHWLDKSGNVHINKPIGIKTRKIDSDLKLTEVMKKILLKGDKYFE